MNDYYFIYKNSQGRWNEATNPRFIASHQYCRAIPKPCIKSISEFLWSINEVSPSNLSTDIVKTIKEFNII
jgi:hypothetical protein